jgi:glycosyltransferase involved in cell wall biosynthesis
MKPVIICLTPVRNEAWCLDVFLKCASLWADHIIIADQNSTDGSREIAKKYSKVILIENNEDEMHQAKTRSLLFSEGRKIPGDKVFVALDADELFSGNFLETADWGKIINSRPGQLFNFKWANVTEDKKNYWIADKWMLWAYHDDGTEFPLDKYIHEWRMPWPKNAHPEDVWISDFYVLHLQFINVKRTESKQRFYQCITKVKEPETDLITLYRHYHYKHKQRGRLMPFDENLISYYTKNGISVFDNLVLTETYFYYDTLVVNYFNKYGLADFKYLDIWDKSWRNSMNSVMKIEDPRNGFIKLLHSYLRLTQKYSSGVFIKSIDKMLKFLFNS